MDNSVLYKSDIRGDELKSKGDLLSHDGLEIPLYENETIRILNCFLLKTLVHSSSHDPERPENYYIRNTVSMHAANIHGSQMEGCFLGPFSTVDLTSLHDCVIGTFSYVQAGELSHRFIEPGTVWVKAGNAFDCT